MKDVDVHSDGNRVLFFKLTFFSFFLISFAEQKKVGRLINCKVIIFRKIYPLILQNRLSSFMVL